MKLKECDTCKKEFPKKELKRLPNEWRCKICQRKKIKEKREFLKRKVLGIRKRSDLEKEWKKTREERENKIPKIKGSIKRVSNKNSLPYLTKTEKHFLYLKHSQNGLTPQEARERIQKDIKHINKMIYTWKQENIEDKEINRRFKEEFTKLISQ